ncbi:TonB-dependent receptor [Nibribacter ruber]|uniref:TonB-dependent receptor n=1 Tax=Nibribacter ruber TaxID=2698458 RepID=A0A6P1NQS6_9BACT|nr:TonB-dependent receptor [Nibribacter ruber]QHL86007.1 TonB-dependent receptor [Nibribacter ruber]
MKKLVHLAVSGLLATHQVVAQAPPTKSAPTVVSPLATGTAPKGSSKIAGLVLDEAGKKPVEFATISLMDKATGKTVDGTISDDKGRFTLTRLAAGQYKLLVSFLGYENKVMEDISLGNKNEVNVGAISLKSDSKVLQEVSVVGEKDLVEDKVDRLVYNAEKDITNAGTSASEVLKKVPGLTVDMDGNVQLRGSSNIRVLINNKPSAMMATSVADALRQIPADLIKSVEVITSPSAKYDAEGTAGIINIITKKNSLQGVNGVVNAGLGNRLSNMNGILNYRKGKFGVNAAAGRQWRNSPMANTRETQYKGTEGLDRLTQVMDGNREGLFQLYQFGLDYDLTPKSSISGGIRFQGGEFTYNTTQASTQYLTNGNTLANTRINNTDFDNSNFDINLDFTQQLAKPGQELSLLGLLSRSNRQTYNFTDIQNGDCQLEQREQNLNDAYNEEKTFQADYMHPFKNKHLLELGAKAILRYAESDYQFLLANPADAPFALVPSRTDVFSYNQNVEAAYATYEFSLNKKYTFKMGSRYEMTQVDGDFVSTKTSVKQKYGNFIPSLAISRKLTESQTVKFNYTKRIQRPQLGYLNPFENRTDTFNIQVGNPNLQAEITNAYELGYSTFFKNGISVNASLYLRKTDNSIQAFVVPTAEGVNYTRFGNTGKNSSYGMSFFGNAKFLKRGNVSGNVNVFYIDLESTSAELNASNASMMYNLNLNTSYAFENGFSAQMAGEFNSRRVALQGKASAMANYSFAVRKEILKKNGSIGLSVDNPFNEKLTQRNSFSTPTVDQTGTTYLYNRQVRVLASYKFGKATGKGQPKKKKKISNDDAKNSSDE